MLDRGQVIRDETGKGIRMVGGMTDLTANKAAEMALGRSHRALQMLSSCNEMLIRATAEEELLAEACGIAVDIGGYRMAWVGYAMEDEQRRVIPMAHAGAEDGYLSEVEITWSEHKPTGVGPAGQAIRKGHAVFLEDITVRPEFLSQTAARSRGYRSVICLPLKNEKKVFGVLCLYGSEPHPNQKPAWLMQSLLGMFCPPNALVLDPYFGSGTTAVGALAQERLPGEVPLETACPKCAKKLLEQYQPPLPQNVNVVGIEGDPRWLDLSIARLRDATPTLVAA